MGSPALVRIPLRLPLCLTRLALTGQTVLSPLRIFGHQLAWVWTWEVLTLTSNHQYGDQYSVPARCQLVRQHPSPTSSTADLSTIPVRPPIALVPVTSILASAALFPARLSQTPTYLSTDVNPLPPPSPAHPTPAAMAVISQASRL